MTAYMTSILVNQSPVNETRPDGTLLIVAGDMTGKGLKVGCSLHCWWERCGALWIGAVVVLRALNQRLLGCGERTATRLVPHIAKHGL
jgi:hypothetical protein